MKKFLFLFILFASILNACAQKPIYHRHGVTMLWIYDSVFFDEDHNYYMTLDTTGTDMFEIGINGETIKLYTHPDGGSIIYGNYFFINDSICDTIGSCYALSDLVGGGGGIDVDPPDTGIAVVTKDHNDNDSIAQLVEVDVSGIVTDYIDLSGAEDGAIIYEDNDTAAYGDITISTAGNGPRISFGSTSEKAVIIGYHAGSSNVFTNNIAIGPLAFENASTNSAANIAIGKEALNDLTTASINNVAIGINAQSHITSGNNNVSLGANTLLSNTTGSGNIAIGNSAAYYETGSNTLYIDNSNTTDPLIYGEFDNDILKINGDLLPKIYYQSTEPDLPNNSMGFWVDSDDSKYYLILDYAGSQKKIELQ